MFLNTSRDGFAQAMDVSVYSLIALTKAAEDLFNPRSSITTLTYHGSQQAAPNYNVMGVAKAALEASVRYLARDLGPRDIRVNAISPGHIDTPIFEGWQKGEALRNMKEDLAKAVPLGRMGDPDEIAKAVSFLASDDASYISGIELFVDGGVAQI